MASTPKDIAHFSIADPADQLRMDAYHATFGEAGHLWLAMHAAFPIALTTDLLYKIWMNFIPYPEDMNDSPYGQLSEQILVKHLSPTDSPIGINAVGDLLLSPLCREIGYDVYEFYPHLREALWKSLPLKRQQQLADFLQRYLEFCPDKVPSKAFAESQRIWSQITLGQFDQVNALLSELYAAPNTSHAAFKRDFILNLIAQKTNAANPTNENALANIPTSNLEKLTQGISAYKQGKHEEAQHHLTTVRQHLSTEKTTKGFNIPIPKNLWESLPVNAPVEPPKEGKIYALLVGIDAYGAGMENKKFSGCINDVHAWQTLLKAHDPSIEIMSLLDAQATKEAIVQALRNAMSTLSPDDTLLFTFSGHAHNKDLPHSLAAYDSIADQRDTYLSETEFKSIISSLYAYNPFAVVILDTHAGSSGWIDTSNEKQVLLAATATGETSMEVNRKGLFTAALQATLEESKQQPTSYRKLIREAYRYTKEKKHKQIPQLFGHAKAINQAFLSGNTSQNTYINEVLQQSNYQHFEQILEDFNIESQEERFIEVLQKYALLKGQEKLKVVRISSEMSVQQIPVFKREYIKSLLYEVEIKDINLFYAPSRGGLKDALLYEEEIEDDLLALQDAQVIVFILNRALVRDFAKHSSIAPVINHLKRFEYKVVCSVLWEDCDRGDTALRDYPVFSLRQPLSRAAFQKYNFAPEVDREIENYYRDWQPVTNKWITDLAALGFEKELKERIEKAKQTKELDLSGMGFEKLPEAVWELEGLKTIDLYNNKLSELPESLTQFQSLEKLYASKNPISSLPLFLSDLPNLRVLKLDDAQITEFPQWLCNHPALEDISLENNQIEIIPSALKDMPKLRLMDFRGNPVINLADPILKATKTRLTNHLATVRKNIHEFGKNESSLELLFLSFDTEAEFHWVVTQLTLSKTLHCSMIEDHNYEAISYFQSQTNKPLIVHIPSIFEDSLDKLTKLSKTFTQYPTGTIFFLNFSNSKRLAELLYQQKHAPIIAFEGDLDSNEALEAVRIFYGHYQESKNAMAAFDQMVLQLVDIPSSSKGLYMLYRY